MRFNSRLLRLASRPPLAGKGVLSPIADAARDASSILVVLLSEIGDAVLFSSFLRNVRLVAPHARLTLVVRPEVAPLFAHSPFVDVVVTYDSRVSRLLRPIVLPFRAVRFTGRRLASEGYDIAIVPRWDVDHHYATAIALFSRASRRVAVSERVNERKSVLNAGFDSLFSDVFFDDAPGHEVEHYGRLLNFLGAPQSRLATELWVGDDDRSLVSDRLHQAGLRDGDQLVAFGIGAAHPRRRWSPERFAEVGAALHERWGVKICLIGGASDVSSQSRIVSLLGGYVLPLAGELTLSQTGAVLAHCSMFVGNDSAPMHLAAAGGVPCIEISCHPISGDLGHVNSPMRFGPWGVPSKVLQPQAADPRCASGCTRDVAHCINGIASSEVIAACEVLVGCLERSPMGFRPPPLVF